MNTCISIVYIKDSFAGLLDNSVSDDKTIGVIRRISMACTRTFLVDASSITTIASRCAEANVLISVVGKTQSTRAVDGTSILALHMAGSFESHLIGR